MRVWLGRAVAMLRCFAVKPRGIVRSSRQARGEPNVAMLSAKQPSKGWGEMSSEAGGCSVGVQVRPAGTTLSQWACQKEGR